MRLLTPIQTQQINAGQFTIYRYKPEKRSLEIQIKSVTETNTICALLIISKANTSENKDVLK